MNYRHAYHAGNFADVFKHILLARMVDYLKKKEKAFRIYDTHSGIGEYDLTSDQAEKTEEWKLGVEKVLQANTPTEVKRLIGPWKDVISSMDKGVYAGSPKVVRSLLRKQDRLSLYELHDEDIVTLKSNFAGDYQTRVNHLDGWLVPGAHIPPKESRGLMLIDPPFEDGKDFDRMISALEKARRRWAGGTIALWYPIKKREHTDEWLGSLNSLKLPDLVSAEIYIQEPRKADSLNGCGMIIANPPYTMRDELHIVLPWLAETMKQAKGWGHRVMDLSGR